MTKMRPQSPTSSILGLFTARGLPTRMLRWHYRSRHQSLIAVSNRQFYENKLYIVPSPYTAQGGRGLRFHHIHEGLFDAGNKRNNLIEARAVAQAIITHACTYPKLSLGVAAFSAAQRRAIIDELELLRRGLSPEVENSLRRIARNRSSSKTWKTSRAMSVTSSLSPSVTVDLCLTVEC